MPELPNSARVVIVGAGFAGAATAYHLTRMGMKDVVILERESVPGAHASGRNAALLRRFVSRDPYGRLCQLGADRILDRLNTSHHMERKCGSLLLCRDDVRSRLERLVKKDDSPGTPSLWLNREEAISRMPILEDAFFDAALYSPNDGILNLQNLLLFYLREARTRGGRLFTSTPVVKILTNQKRITGVRTPSRTVQTGLVVNAAGAWAGALASSADAVHAPLQPYRRHLFRLVPGSEGSATLPWIWDLSRSYYIRPDTDGWIASCCDEEPHPPHAPRVAPDAALQLARVLIEHLPHSKTWSVDRTWACLRTFTADRQPLIGPDPVRPGFYWAAGLGGHGVTTSDIIGELTARTILGQPLQGPARSFDPKRYH